MNADPIFARFDNPDTFLREWYREGEKTAHVDERVLVYARKDTSCNNPFTPEALETWEAGRIVGDPLALPEHYQPK